MILFFQKFYLVCLFAALATAQLQAEAAGGGGGGGGDPLREKAEESKKAGEDVRKQMETNGKAGSDSIAKVMDNFSQNLAQVNKVTETEDLQSGFKALQGMNAAIGQGGNANGSAVDMIVNSYRDIAQLHMLTNETKEAGQAAALANAPNSVEAPAAAKSVGNYLGNLASDSSYRQLKDGLATAQNATVKNASVIPSIASGTGYGAPPSTASTGNVSGGASADGSSAGSGHQRGGN